MAEAVVFLADRIIDLLVFVTEAGMDLGRDLLMALAFAPATPPAIAPTAALTGPSKAPAAAPAAAPPTIPRPVVTSDFFEAVFFAMAADPDALFRITSDARSSIP